MYLDRLLQNFVAKQVKQLEKTASDGSTDKRIRELKKALKRLKLPKDASLSTDIVKKGKKGHVRVNHTLKVGGKIHTQTFHMAGSASIGDGIKPVIRQTEAWIADPVNYNPRGNSVHQMSKKTIEPKPQPKSQETSKSKKTVQSHSKNQVKLRSLLGGVPFDEVRLGKGGKYLNRRGFTLNPLQKLIDTASVKAPLYPEVSPSIAHLEAELAKLGSPELLGPRARARYFRLSDKLYGLTTAAKAKAKPGRVTQALKTPAGRAIGKAFGAAALLNAPWAVYDTRKDWNLENLGYLGDSKPWLETARTVAGLDQATLDMFDEADNPDFWKALPGEIGRSALNTGEAFFVDPVTRAIDALPSHSESTKIDKELESAAKHPGSMTSRWR